MEINAEECLKANDNLYVQADVESVLMKDCTDGPAPVVSIVIPAYKRVSMLKHALSSALSQDTVLPYEVVVVEDNPEPDTEIGDYLECLDDPRLRYLKNSSNLGLVGNFNRALTVGRGDITVILHDDDFLLPSYVREIVRIMVARPDADIVCPRPFKWLDGTPLELPEDDGRPARLWKPLTSWEPFCRTFIPTGMAIRRSSIARSGGFDYVSGPSTDLYFIVRAGLSGLNYYNYDKTLFVYRWSENESLKFSTRCAFIEAGFHLAGCCIWVKDSLVLGRSDYQWQHEPVLYGFLQNGKHPWYSDRKQTTVWNFAKPKRNANHPTSKPLDLLAYPIGNSSQENAIVLDTFGGSGSTMMACEQSNRICCMMELDEKYASVILRRAVENGISPEDIFVERGGQKIPYADLVKEVELPNGE